MRDISTEGEEGRREEENDGAAKLYGIAERRLFPAVVCMRSRKTSEMDNKQKTAAEHFTSLPLFFYEN